MKLVFSKLIIPLLFAIQSITSVKADCTVTSRGDIDFIITSNVVTCKYGACHNLIVDGCAALICDGENTCSSMQVKNTNKVICKGTNSCPWLKTTNVDIVECTGDAVCGAIQAPGVKEVKCQSGNTQAACDSASFTGIQDGGWVNCIGQSACIEAKINPATDSSIAVRCKGKFACATQQKNTAITAGPNGQIDCEGDSSCGALGYWKLTLNALNLNCSGKFSCGTSDYPSSENIMGPVEIKSNGGTISCSKQACSMAIISGGRNVFCADTATCTYADISEVQDGGKVRCTGRSACKSSNIKAETDGSIQVLCDSGDKVDAYTGLACSAGSFSRSIVAGPNGNIDCNGETSCQASYGGTLTLSAGCVRCTEGTGACGTNSDFPGTVDIQSGTCPCTASNLDGTPYTGSDLSFLANKATCTSHGSTPACPNVVFDGCEEVRCDGYNACIKSKIINTDTVTCNGSYACKAANISGIPNVVCDSLDSQSACVMADILEVPDGGKVECTGNSACFNPNIQSAEGASVQITCDSKDAEYACTTSDYNRHLEFTSISAGSQGTIACKGAKACSALDKELVLSAGSTSCKGQSSCSWINDSNNPGGTVNLVNHLEGVSCGETTCFEATLSNNEKVSCKGDIACLYAEISDSTEVICDPETGSDACYYADILAVKDGGKVECFGHAACYSANIEAASGASINVSCDSGDKDLACATNSNKHIYAGDNGIISCDGDQACSADSNTSINTLVAGCTTCHGDGACESKYSRGVVDLDNANVQDVCEVERVSIGTRRNLRRA